MTPKALHNNSLWAYSLCGPIAQAETTGEQQFYILWLYNLGFRFYFV